MAISITLPFTEQQAISLHAGDSVLISGTLYTARDAAHKRMVEGAKEGKPFPFALTDQIVYYAGPTPKRPGFAVGSCGPTTSGRMDPYAPYLLARGLRGMIGKGQRSAEVIEAMKQAKAVYFGAIGGAGALIASSVVSCEEIAYEDLGAESVKKMIVRDFPAIVVIDTFGNNLYDRNRAGEHC